MLEWNVRYDIVQRHSGFSRIRQVSPAVAIVNCRKNEFLTRSVHHFTVQMWYWGFHWSSSPRIVFRRQSLLLNNVFYTIHHPNNSESPKALTYSNRGSLPPFFFSFCKHYSDGRIFIVFRNSQNRKIKISKNVSNYSKILHIFHLWKG